MNAKECFATYLLIFGGKINIDGLGSREELSRAVSWIIDNVTDEVWAEFWSLYEGHFSTTVTTIKYGDSIQSKRYLAEWLREYGVPFD